MKLPLDWLQGFVAVKESLQEVGDLFTRLGFETESIGNDVIDLEITPNRGDALSIYGLAREYAAVTNRKLSKIEILKLNFFDRPRTIKVDNSMPSVLTRHSGLVFTIDQIGPSSDKIQKKLISVGIRPINTIVDITNYVMVELGLPLHAFDVDQIKNTTMHFRLSNKDETIQTIDGRSHRLPAGALVIEDEHRLIDLVGIIGAANSSIRPQSRRIFVHCPILDPKIIRQTTKRLGIMTDAAYRYERLVDWGQAKTALERVWRLISQESETQLIEAFDSIYQKPDRAIICVLVSDISKTLGITISIDQACDYLGRLGFDVVQKKERIEVAVPTWRIGDIKYPVDVIEEIARMHSYGKIPKLPLSKTAIRVTKNNFRLKNQISQWLVAQGFQEVLTPTFISESEVRLLGYNPTNQYTIQSSAENPETRYLRPSMIATLAKVLVRNNWYGQLKIFEIGEIFAHKKEQTKVCLAHTGDQKKYWLQYVPESKIRIVAPADPLAKFVKLRTLVTFVETDLGVFADWVREIKINEPILTRISYRPYSRFTPVVRDIALVVDESTNAKTISCAIASVDERIFLVDLFDDYQSDKFGSGKISRAFHVIFDNVKSQILESEVDEIWENIIKIVQEKKWVIRG